MEKDTVIKNDKKVLRELAKRYKEVAQTDEMTERKQLWRNLHDLKPKRPMILFEPFSLEGYLSDYQIKCKDPKLRNVETKMIFSLRQYEQIGDDIDIFFGLVDGFEKELGYFSLSELENLRGPFGLKVERDLYFEPATLKELMK